PLEADALAAVLALVDVAFVETAQRAVDLPEQELFAITEPQLRRKQFFLHGLVDRIATDVAFAIHAEGEPVFGILDQARAFCLEDAAQLLFLALGEHDVQDIDAFARSSTTHTQTNASRCSPGVALDTRAARRRA